MSREGRAQPIQPFATHGFLGNVPANGTLPGRILVVENDDRRRKTGPLPSVILNGAYAVVVAPTATPPGPVNVDRLEQRARYLPLPPVKLTGIPADQFAGPTVNPPAPFVVPLDERRRFLASIPAETNVGFDAAVPPEPNVSEPDDRRRKPKPTDPISILGVPVDQFTQFASPPEPYVVPIDQRGRFIVTLPSTGQHGFVDPGPAPVGTTPPPPTNLDRVDQRVRYKPLDPIVLTAALHGPGLPPPPVVVLGGTDWAASIATW